MTVSLEEVLSYQHPAVVRRFQKEYSENSPQAEQIFSDLLMFFWASKKHSLELQNNPENENLNFLFIMDDEMKSIDQMWHIFLLYTKDYMDFCERYFGEYLHHLPDIVPGFKEGEFDAESNLCKFLSYVFDHLGEETVKRWFPISCQ
jgi:hypothetical protein